MIRKAGAKKVNKHLGCVKQWCVYCYCFEVYSLEFINTRYFSNDFNVWKIKKTLKRKR